MNRILIPAFIMLFLFSCSIHLEKRVYNKGYYLQITKKKKSELRNGQVENETNESSAKASSAKLNSITNDDSHLVLSNNNNENLNKRADEKILNKEDNPENKITVSSNNHTGIKRKSNLKSDHYSNVSTFVNKRKTIGDYLLGIVTAIAGISVFGLLRMKRKRTFKITEWAKRNKWKSRFIIGGIQTLLGTVGILTGFEMSETGFSLSDNTEFLYGGLMSAGFLSLLRKKESFILLNSFDRMKLGHILIGTAFFATTVGVGYKLSENRQQNTPLGTIMENTNFSEYSNVNTSMKTAFSASTESEVGWLIFLYVILTLLLIAGLAVLSCAAFCGGGGALGIPVLLGSIIIIVLVIRAMSRSVKRRKGTLVE